jgi:hypothetical protein
MGFLPLIFEETHSRDKRVEHDQPSRGDYGEKDETAGVWNEFFQLGLRRSAA